MTETKLREVLDEYCRLKGPLIYRVSEHELDREWQPYEVRVSLKFNEPKKNRIVSTRAADFADARYQMVAYFGRSLSRERGPDLVEDFKKLLVGRWFTDDEARELSSRLIYELLLRTPRAES